MSIKFACPYCGKTIVATALMVGKEHTCPHCRGNIEVPPKSDATLEATGAVVTASRQQPFFTSLKKSEEENLIDMTAMVDIVFFLLIFFMVTSIQALQSVMEMPPPQSAGASAGQQVAPDYTDDPSFITITIEADDSIWLDNERVFGAQELREKLRDLREDNLQLSEIMVLGDPEASHGTLVMVLDAGADAGIEDLRFSVSEDRDPFAS